MENLAWLIQAERSDGIGGPGAARDEIGEEDCMSAACVLSRTLGACGALEVAQPHRRLWQGLSETNEGVRSAKMLGSV